MSSNEVRERVLQLKYAIWHLETLKKHLNTNASNSRAQIHTNFNQIMECLRGREVSLLSQVDQTLRVKEETLHHQQVRLSQTLGVLQSAILNGTATEGHLDDIIEKLKNLELTPEETPYISLKSGHSNLLESILNYGTVDGNGEPLMTTFGYPGGTATNFPCPEYYDLDNNILFNNLMEGVKKDQVSASNAHFVLPQLSNHTEDWLQKQIPNNRIDDSNTSARVLLAPCPENLTNSPVTHAKYLSTSSTSGGSCWLMKQSVDPKEQHYLDFSSLRTAATEGKSNGGGKQSSTNLFQPISTDLKNWLSPGTGCSSNLYSAFNSVPDDSKVWLLQACQQLTSLNDLKHKNHFHHVSKEPSSWLCSQSCRKQQTCQKEQDEDIFFSHISKDKDFWLHKPSEMNTLGKNEHKVVVTVDKSCDTKTSCCKKTSAMEVDEKWLSSATSNTPVCLKDICRANELCGSLSECVSKPDCCTLWFQERSPVKNVIDPTQAFKPISLKLHDWLSPVSQNDQKLLAAVPNGKDTNNLFQHLQDINSSVWLMNSAYKNVAAIQSPHANFKGSKEESNLWLQKTGFANPPEPMVTDKSSSTSLDTTLHDWLIFSNDENGKPQEMHDQDKESEGWSVCSDSHSACTDQCVKDIAAANEYYSKWLLT